MVGTIEAWDGIVLALKERGEVGILAVAVEDEPIYAKIRLQVGEIGWGELVPPVEGMYLA